MLELPVLNLRIVVPILGLLILLSIGAAIQSHFVGDVYVTKNVQSVDASPWAKVMQLASVIGSLPVVIAAASSVMIWFLYKGQRPKSLLVIAAVMTLPIVSVVKELVGRHRPTEEIGTVWYDLDSLSFPSGHSFTAVVIFGLFFYIAPLLVRSINAVTVIRVASITMIGLIGMSRVYLGADWASDVLGGFLYGGVALGFLIYLHRCHIELSRPRTIP